jgi:uncharacterized membrane protein
MTLLILGLVVFLGVHSARVFADGARGAFIARHGIKAWKGLYAAISLAGFALVVWGFGLARQQPIVLWTPPVWTRHLAALVVLVAFVLVAAAYVPGNGITARLHHPMTLGVKAWSFAHLIANRTLADAVLFGTFLVWSITVYAAARRRDRAAGTSYPPGTTAATALTVLVGLVLWAAFAFWAHGWLIGVRPFG